jgi:hypothetical protein
MITPGGPISPATEYIRRELPNYYPKMSLPPRCRSMVLVLGERQSAALRPATVSFTDYELAIFARVLGVSLVWLTGDLEQKE